MTKLQVFWYLSESFLLALYIGFFAVMSNSIWIGILTGVGLMIMRTLVSRALDKVKVEK